MVPSVGTWGRRVPSWRQVTIRWREGEAAGGSGEREPLSDGGGEAVIVAGDVGRTPGKEKEVARELAMEEMVVARVMVEAQVQMSKMKELMMAELDQQKENTSC